MKDINNYKDFRDKWKHEDLLINHRISWLFITQTILITGYINILMNDSDLILEKAILNCMVAIGIIFTIVIGISIFAAIIAMKDLKRNFKGNQLIETSIRATRWGFFASRLIPILFLFLWFGLMIFNLFFR
ncbi:MAG TPA: hypothetical protein DEO70_09180 [Bacteroidales bacterium]|nr:MAG: hypothetical protein A2X11_15440 [Bacteroidetes bacterium GWE2_42_24]HBZ66998.1 hypothetical protein [Bacteroidales bacterium]